MDKTLTLLTGIGLTLVLSLGGNVYLWHQLSGVQESFQSTQITASSTASSLTNELLEASTTAASLNFELAALTEQYEKLQEDYAQERYKNEDFEDQIRGITKKVGTLDKLAKTDEELLQKYSKVYFLNENYAPANIRPISDVLILAGKDAQYFHGEALPFLTNMIDDAKQDGVDLKVISAYRSFDHQAQLKGAYTQTYGSGANTFSADQGYSEHQLGTTLDLTTPSIGGTYTSFKDTEAYAWLLKNAHGYGFILSYPQDNGYYIFEPWHWRFVGEDLAEHLHKNDLHFYDLDQRTIDTYLIKLFD